MKKTTKQTLRQAHMVLIHTIFKANKVYRNNWRLKYLHHLQPHREPLKSSSVHNNKLHAVHWVPYWVNSSFMQNMTKTYNVPLRSTRESSNRHVIRHSINSSALWAQRLRPSYSRKICQTWGCRTYQKTHAFIKCIHMGAIIYLCNRAPPPTLQFRFVSKALPPLFWKP